MGAYMKALRLLSFCCLTCAVISAQQISPGIVIPASLETSLDSSTTKPGRTILAKIQQDVPLEQGRLARGTQIVGHVALADAAKHILVLSFDSLRTKQGRVTVRTSLRAIASPTAVNFAQLPTTATPDRGTPPAAWTTQQIGNDVVYRGGGHVMRGETIVGEPVPGGVLGRLRNSPGQPCQADHYGDTPPVALWVFSTDACGVYGYPGLEIAHAGRSAPVGQIEFQQDSKIHLYRGTGLLLRVLP
jgi:hypothetical protein